MAKLHIYTYFWSTTSWYLIYIFHSDIMLYHVSCYIMLYHVKHPPFPVSIFPNIAWGPFLWNPKALIWAAAAATPSWTTWWMRIAWCMSWTPVAAVMQKVWTMGPPRCLWPGMWMEEMVHQLIGSLFHYRVLIIQGGAGFLPSTIGLGMDPDGDGMAIFGHFC